MSSVTLALAPPLLLLLLVAGIILAEWRERRRGLAEASSGWGRQRETPREEAVAARLFRAAPQAAPDAFALDDRTWADLDLDELFVRLDRCLTPIGAQALYRTLRTPLLAESTLVKRSALVAALAEDAELRARIQRSLLALRDPRAGRVVELLWGEPPRPHPLAALAPLLALAVGALIVLAWHGITSWALLLPAFLIASLLHFGHQRRTEALPLAWLAALLGAGRSLGALDDVRLGEPQATLAGLSAPLRGMRRALAPLQVEDGTGLLQYAKILFLLDVIAYRLVFRALCRRRAELRAVFEAVGALDAALAVASYLTEHGRVCRPLFTAGGRYRLAGVVHPLLAAAVPNDLPLVRPALLVTGSNMSGKTTFLKAIALAVVLAQTWRFAHAAAYELPFLRVLTSIGRADNLIEGRSYYLAEVESVRRLVAAASSPEPYLLIADELFRGTNADERIAAATEVLRHLADGHHLVLAATHDLEVVALLASVFDVCHFRESVEDDGLHFDFTLRAGASTTRNAIALLAHAGYPVPLVQRAASLAAALRTQRTPAETEG